MRFIISAVLGAFIVLSTFYNFKYGLGISILAAATYTLYGVAEVILGVLLGGADKAGRAVGSLAICLLLSVSLFTAVALKLSEAHAMEYKAKDIKGQAARAAQGSDAALSSLKILQQAYASAKAEYDSFPVGSASANRRKGEVTAALKNMQAAQQAYSQSGAAAQQASSKVESNEAEIYRLLSKWLGASPQAWAAAFFMLNAVIIVFGFSAILYVWRHQRPGTKYCIKFSDEAERAIADARLYELELKNSVRAAEIIDRANRKLKGRGAVEKMPIPELPKAPDISAVQGEPAANTPSVEPSKQPKAASVAIPIKITPDGMMREVLHVGGGKIHNAIIDTGCSHGASISQKFEHLVAGNLTGSTLVTMASGPVEVKCGSALLRIEGASEVTATVSINESDETLIGKDLLNQLGASVGPDSLTIKEALASESPAKGKGGRPKLTKEQEEFNVAKRLVKEGKLNATQTSLTSAQAKGEGLRLGRDRAKEFAKRLSA